MMTAPDLLRVAAGERETVRVFAVGLPPERARSFLDDHAQIEVAVGALLDPDHIESFKVEDLKGVGLAQYLIDGYGIAEADIAPHEAMLDKAGPFLLLLRARAFGGEPVTLAPKPPLQPLGVYTQAGAATSAPTPARELEHVAPEQGPNRPEPTKRGSLAPLLIFVALAAILFAVLIVPKL